MKFSEPITDQVKFTTTANTSPPPISMRISGENFDRVQINYDGIYVGDGTAAPTQVIDVTADSTWPDGVDVAVGSTSGTKIGTATTQKLGFFNATPVVQRSAYTQTYSTADRTVAAATQETLTDSTTGSASNTLAAGVGVYELVIPITLAGVANGDVLTNLVLGHKFKILATTFAVTTAVTTGSKATTLNLEIGTTNLTGGEVALTSANCTPLGALVAGAAVTAANTGSAADTLSIEASSTTAFAEGAGVLVIRVQNMDTADAFASLVDEHVKGVADDLDNRQTLNALIDDLQALGFAG